MKLSLKRQLIPMAVLMGSLPSLAQWEPVMNNVLIVDIALSPDFSYDETLFVLDNQLDIYRSTDNGQSWEMIYQALDPYIEAEKVLDIVLSPDFKNDHRVIIIHLDGSAEGSYDSGETWENQPVPAGTTSIVFSPDYVNDKIVFAATGAGYSSRFYRSVDKGATWAETVNFGITGYYTRLFNSADPASFNALAIQTGADEVLLSEDGGYTWTSASDAFTLAWDVAFSGNFSQDNTLFLSTARKIYRNTEGGTYFEWTEEYYNEESFGIDLALSPTFTLDHTLYAGIDQQGIYRSVDGGDTWTAFNSGLESYYPISLAAGGSTPIFSLFAGTQNSGGLPDRLWRYRLVDAVSEPGGEPPLDLSVAWVPSATSLNLVMHVNKEGTVNIDLVTLTGETRTILSDKDFNPGTYTFGIDPRRLNLPAGLFLITATSDSYRLGRKIVVLPY